MRVPAAPSLVPALLALAGLAATAQAQEAGTEHVCRALGGDGRWHISGSVMLPQDAGPAMRRAERDFRASVLSASGGARELWCAPRSGSSLSSYIDGLEQVLRGEGRQTVRTNWTRTYLSSSAASDDSASYAQESEASRRVVDARYREQHERERANADEFARMQAAHQARVEQAAQQRSEHQAAMAQNAREQADYQRARADWEARVASCRAGNHSACAAPATPR